MEKQCTKCKKTHDISFFNKHGIGSPYLRSWCKNCNSISITYSQRAEYLKKYSKDYRKNPENQNKIKARQIIIQAIRHQTITRPTKCSQCSSNANIEAHHEDYSKPLEIIWLCKKCHYQADIKLKNPC